MSCEEEKEGEEIKIHPFFPDIKINESTLLNSLANALNDIIWNTVKYDNNPEVKIIIKDDLNQNEILSFNDRSESLMAIRSNINQYMNEGEEKREGEVEETKEGEIEETKEGEVEETKEVEREGEYNKTTTEETAIAATSTHTSAIDNSGNNNIGGGVLLFIYSVILSRGIERVKDDKVFNDSLISMFGNTSAELVNLLLVGYATQNV